MAEGDGREIAWLDELVAQVRGWHGEALKAGGGATGEHTARLHASCARPFQSAFGQDIFPTDLDKAAALFHGIVCNHPFVDGNKRTATFAAVLFLVARHVVVGDVTRLIIRLLGDLAIETASSPHLTVDDVKRWLPRIVADLVVQPNAAVP